MLEVKLERNNFCKKKLMNIIDKFTLINESHWKFETISFHVCNILI